MSLNANLDKRDRGTDIRVICPEEGETIQKQNAAWIPN